MNKRILIFILAGLIFSTLFYSCKSNNDELVVLYDKEFAVVKQLAQESNRAFALILSRPDCPACLHYIRHLGELYADLASKVIFNVVDISLPENQWYRYWLATGASPTTSIFSRRGELKAVVAGITRNAIGCVKSSVANHTQCSRYLYEKHFRINGDAIQMLNVLLKSRFKLSKGEDISNAINPILRITNHPYAIYLKALNEEKQGRQDEAVYWANRFMSVVNTNNYFSRVYAGLLASVRTIINPNHMPGDEGVLSVIEELALGEFRFRESKPFSLTVTNTGGSSLSILHTEVGCSCLTMLSDKQQTIEPGESKVLDFRFTADIRGEILREIVFVSNGINPVEVVAITAKVR